MCRSHQSNATHLQALPGSSAPGSVKHTNWLQGLVGHLIGWAAKENFKHSSVVGLQPGARAEHSMHNGVCA